MNVLIVYVVRKPWMK